MIGLGDIELTLEIIELMAGTFSQRGDARRAAKLLGTAEALREQAGMAGSSRPAGPGCARRAYPTTGTAAMPGRVPLRPSSGRG